MDGCHGLWGGESRGALLSGREVPLAGDGGARELHRARGVLHSPGSVLTATQHTL